MATGQGTRHLGGKDQDVARLRALRRLAERAGEVTAALARGRERVAAVAAAEDAAGHRRAMAPDAQRELRDTDWELRRLQAELRLLREEFEGVRATGR